MKNILAYDLVTVNGQIQFNNSGDVYISVMNNELATCLIYTTRGEFKKSPLSGCNIKSYINKTVQKSDDLNSIVKQQFKNDGFESSDVEAIYNQSKLDYEIKITGDRIR